MQNPLETQVGGNHYKDLAIQPAEFCQRNRIPYCEANAIKYLCRHRLKGGREDLLKARHYVDLALEMEYPEPRPNLNNCQHCGKFRGHAHECENSEKLPNSQK